MTLSYLQAIAQLFSSYQMIFSLRRLEHNLFLLILDFDEFYLDLTKRSCTIFVSEKKILGSPHCAPFDLALSKYCSRAKLLSCSLDGNNRILILSFLYQNQYKQQKLFLHFEFTGKHTNVILVDENQMVLEALRHIGENRSSRVIKPQKPFTPLPQPKNPPLLLPQTQEIKTLLRKEAQLFYHERLEQKRAVVLRALQKKRTNAQALLQALPLIETLKMEAERFLKWGNLILMHLHTLSYFHSPLLLQDLDGKEEQIIIPQKISSFQEAANFFFTQSKKCKKKIENLHLQSENLRSKIDFLNAQIALSEHTQDLEALQIFSPKSNKERKERKQEYESFFIDGFKVSVGKNQKENIKLLQEAKADDLWLHLQSIPSSHMIIHCGKKQPREEMIYQSAKLLAGLSGKWSEGLIVDYTRRKFVKIIEGANVVYAKQKSLKI